MRLSHWSLRLYHVQVFWFIPHLNWTCKTCFLMNRCHCTYLFHKRPTESVYWEHFHLCRSLTFYSFKWMDVYINASKETECFSSLLQICGVQISSNSSGFSKIFLRLFRNKYSNLPKPANIPSAYLEKISNTQESLRHLKTFREKLQNCGSQIYNKMYCC